MEKPSSLPLSKGWVLTVAVLGIVALCVLTLATLTHSPAEDAVILHQYSKNLADTGIISYIPGGRPAEGATDFLWMLFVALGLKLHAVPVLSTAIANIVCAAGLSYVLLRLAGRRFQVFPAAAIFGALALMPQIFAAAAGFSVLPFALLIATTIMFSEEGNDVATAISALLLCLLRPDGVVFAMPLIARRLWFANRKGVAALWYIGIFVLPGTMYFIWRWHYFGHFLPLPFLVKSDTKRFLGIFGPTSHELVRYLVFGAIGIGVALGKNLRRGSEASLILAAVIIPSLFYSAMRLDQNLFFRFYYFIPVVTAIIIAQHWDALAWGRPALIGALLAAFVVCLAKTDVTSVRDYKSYSAYWRRNEEIAKQLSAMHGNFLTSEAGEFAYFSRWNTYDSWGLDTPEYAVHLIQPKDVVSLAPDLIALHTENCQPRVAAVQRYRTFDNMYSNVRAGVALHGGYDVLHLFMPRSHSNETKESLCWYVAQGFPEKARIEAILVAYGATPEN